MASRVDKLKKLFLTAISEIILKEVKDPRVKNVTVTGVDIAKDIKSAKVYTEVFKGDITEALQGLNAAAGFIQTRLGKSAKLRNTPKLLFLRDESFDYAQKINKIIKAEKNEHTERDS